MSPRYEIRTPALVRELMSEYGELTREVLLRSVPQREPRRYLYDLVGEYPRRRGRYMRPAICIASARAHGATVEQAIHSAAFIEMLHNALLVVDDIQDGSVERRGQPTLHETHGIPVALNVGTTMSILSLVPLLRNVETCGPHVALWVFERAIEAAQLCAEGQALELGWRLDNRTDVSEAEYLDMVLKKTCSYSTMFPLSAGAIIGGSRNTIPTSLRRYGFLLGAAFQIQDDLLNLWGDHEKYGKELGGDLLEGKRTLLTIHLGRSLAPRDRGFLHEFLGRKREEKADEEVHRIIGWMHAHGTFDHVRRMMHGLVGAAQHAFSESMGHLAPSRDRDFLGSLCPWVIEQV